jgi:cytochrome c-type biogenesis protein CcmH
MKRFLALVLLILCAALAAPAFAVQPDEVLDDPVLEQRARGISTNLRCLVCQNQTIDDSDAPLARDLRILVRERLLAGDTDEETMDYVVDRYGEFVLLNPVVAPHTLILWLAAPLVLGAGGLIILLALGRRPTIDPAGEPTGEEAAVLEELRKSEGGTHDSDDKDRI